MQAGCGFKTPSPVFAVPHPVGGAESARRLGVTSSPLPRDAGNDVITVGKRSGQWVTLSKALLLQLVERICQLSFQTDVTSSYHRKSPDEFETEPDVESLPRRPTSGNLAELAAEAKTGSDVMDEDADLEVSAVPAYLDDDLTASGRTLGCDHQSTTSCADVHHISHVGSQSPTIHYDDAKITPDNAGESPASGSSPDIDQSPIAVNETADCRVSGGAAATDEDRGPTDECRVVEYQSNDRRQRQRRRTSVCRRRLLRARRRTKLPLATYNGQVRKLVARTGYHSARSTDSAGRGTRQLLRGVRRCRQSWMALSKDIVYGAVENQLRQQSPAAAAISRSSTIWNPAISASPSEKRHRQSRPPITAAVGLSWYCGDAAPHLTGSDVRPSDAPVGSSMLSELLGFGGSAAAMILPSEVVGGAAAVRQRHWSDLAAASRHDVMTSPPQHARADRDDDVTAGAVNYCIRRARTEPSDMDVAPQIWRPVDSTCRGGPERPSPTGTAARRPPAAATPPRWIAVNKGEVCSLVDTLVSTMIATADHDGAKSGGQPLPAEMVSGETASDISASTSSSSSVVPSKSSEKTVLDVSARCSLSASEPRKWKTDLLHRMRSEHT